LGLRFPKPAGPPGKVIGYFQNDDFSVVTSLSQLSEIIEVLGRPRLSRRFRYTTEEAELFVRLIATRAEVVPTFGGLKMCRDPDDDEILEAAIQGKAEYLVTRDNDLKRDLDLIEMAQGNGVRVISIRMFLRLLSRAAAR
jgi:putative toxin-antitoxin system toxin component, PIN family